MFSRATGKPRRATAVVAIAFSAMLALAACNDADNGGTDAAGGLDTDGTADTVDTVDDGADN